MIKKDARQKASPGKLILWGIGALILAFIVQAISSSSTPTTQMQALLPGMIVGALGWVAIILVLAGIIRWVIAKVKK